MICGFGWLMEKLGRISWKVPNDVAALVMVTDSMMKRTDILAKDMT